MLRHLCDRIVMNELKVTMMTMVLTVLTSTRMMRMIMAVMGEVKAQRQLMPKVFLVGTRWMC